MYISQEELNKSIKKIYFQWRCSFGDIYWMIASYEDYGPVLVIGKKNDNGGFYQDYLLFYIAEKVTGLKTYYDIRVEQNRHSDVILYETIYGGIIDNLSDIDGRGMAIIKIGCELIDQYPSDEMCTFAINKLITVFKNYNKILIRIKGEELNND